MHKGVLSVVCCQHKNRQISILGTWATPKHNESVDIGEKRAAVCFELFDRTYKRYK